MKYNDNYCEERGISTSELNEAQRTLYYIAENMKMDKSISEEGYKHFQIAITALEESKVGHWVYDDECKEHGHCSHCGYGEVDLVDGKPHNFCRNCGWHMV